MISFKGEGCSSWEDPSSHDDDDDDNYEVDLSEDDSDSTDTTALNPEPLPLMEGRGEALKVLGFTKNQRARFVKILMRLYPYLLVMVISNLIT